MNALRAATSFLLPKLRPVVQFMAKQGLTTAGNLLCVRLLSTGDCIKFVVLFGLQGTVAASIATAFHGSAEDDHTLRNTAIDHRKTASCL